MSVGGAPPTWATPSGSLDDARHRAGSNSRADGLKVQAAISGSENVVGAILFGTYWFARIVYELSVHSRLASLRSTTTVETDHPLLSFQLPDAQRYRRPSDTSAYNRPTYAVKTENPSHEERGPREHAQASSLRAPLSYRSFVDSSLATIRRLPRTSNGRKASPRNAANRMKEARNHMASAYSCPE